MSRIRTHAHDGYYRAGGPALAQLRLARQRLSALFASRCLAKRTRHAEGYAAAMSNVIRLTIGAPTGDTMAGASFSQLPGPIQAQEAPIA